MKVPPAKADTFSKSPDSNIRAILVYGPDEGLVQERSKSLVLSVVDDPLDPFRIVDLDNDQLKKQPALLSDEAAAISMMGGRRVVKIRSAGDALANCIKDFLQDPIGDALIIFEGGDLPARSKLRKIFESEKSAAAIACYKDDEKSLPNVIRQTVEKEGLFISNDALSFLVTNLGTDRRLTRRELQKLCLYKGKNSGNIELEDAIACIGDTATLTLDDIALSVAMGNIRNLENNLRRAQQENQNAITILRSVSRHFQKLHMISGLVTQGIPLDKALGTLRPPLFWKVAEPFKAQVRKWSPKALAKALSMLMETEANCKKTGSPAEILCARTLLEITAKAPTRIR
ncbi:DNA polymerase III subunit delta [Kiloniella antarctica]|uniref:DNA-directed DNA polymerase n=1 Tax=Kiloniella antarctica TaxID=1550907 RepID=A0ABW5BFK8_9PROT